MKLLPLGLLILAGCATTAAPPHPALVCVPAMTDQGQQVIYCQPYREAE